MAKLRAEGPAEGKGKHSKWFREAVMAKPPYTLGGWDKHQSPAVRRRCAMESRPANWSTRTRRRSAARALQALANVTKDSGTRSAARSDANYFYRLLR